MLTATDKKYFIDPIRHHEDSGDTILVVDVMHQQRRAALEGTVQKVTGQELQRENRGWRVTADGGANVDGPIVNPTPNLPRRVRIIGWIEGAEEWFYGSASYNYAGMRQVMYARSSLQMSLPDTGYGAVTQYARAAEWAEDLMPLSTDPADVVEQKLALAKVKWEERRLKMEIVRQGYLRAWTHDLEGLREKGHSVPDPVYAYNVNATATLPAGNTSSMLIPEETGRFLMQASGADAIPNRVALLVSTSVQVSVIPAGDAPTQREVLAAVQNKIPDFYNVGIADYTHSRNVVGIKDHVPA